MTPVVKLWSLMWCPKALICFMPIDESAVNSTQMVPIVVCGSGFLGLTKGLYLSIMALVGRALKFIFLRL